MSQPISSEQVIRRLYQITYDHQKGFDHQIIKLLEMGLERFGLDIGILSKIDDNDYIVQHCVTPESVPMQAGDRFDFNATYCSITCAAKEPVAIEHMGKNDQYATHPAYKAFGLESYIGVPIYLDNQFYGTLNFSSPTPMPRKFLDVDIDALQLMASWIGVELIRQEQEVKLKALNQELKYQAEYDSLTNIPNRRGMYSTLKKGLNQINRRRGECVIAIIDIDYFKKLNDTYGHQTGDEIITAIAHKITDSIRDYECVARMGGDEFLLWLPDTNQVGSDVVFNRILQNIATISTIPDPVTVSIGACHFRFSNRRSSDLIKLIDSLIAKADSALYQAKDEGRNGLVYHDETLTESLLGLT